MGPIITPVIIIATPHNRNDMLVRQVQDQLPGYHIIRLREKDELTFQRIEQIRPDFIFFPHWSWLIPDTIHENFNCVIFHMTDLPYGRGGSPLQNLIIRGHGQTQLTALKCVSEIDAGPIFMKQPLSLAGTAEEILCRASALMSEMIVKIVKEHPSPVPQDGEVTMFTRRRPGDGNLAPLKNLQSVYDVIRMLDAEGYPPAFMETTTLYFEFTSPTMNGNIVEATVRIREKKHE